MPATNKTGTQLLLSQHIKTRGQALAVVRQEAVAEVWRILIEQALPGMESAHAGQLKDLRDVLEGSMSMDYAEGVDAMLKNRIRFGDLFRKDGQPLRRFPATTV